ncbi:MAG: cytochrome c3 family protein [Planctomycetaceae bacterium]
MVVDKPRNNPIRVWPTIMTLVVIGLLTWWLLPQAARDPEPMNIEFPVPARAESPYLNTQTQATYVGSQSCAACHEHEFASYLETEHSRALQDVRLSDEPPDTEFFHEASGRWYRVYRKDEQMWHRAWIQTQDERALILADYAMESSIGSGHHSRSYLLKQDGFLLESPITWYAARDDWGMSPGYDQQVHSEFSRMVDAGCLICHAGRVEPAETSAHQVTILHAVIGCESCHGPGSLHLARRESPSETAGQHQHPDLTIVNPSQLDRSLQESVCAECHLRGNATVYVRGRQLGDFRPGLPLADVRTDYVLESPEKSMNVVGHIEQMRMSACYRGSDSMTCTTCHNPHSRPSDNQRIDYFRDTCLTCHTEDACGLDKARRFKTNPADHCVACHMPRTSTDIPHLAFTHHRIAIHTEDPDSEQPDRRAALVPIQSRRPASAIDRDRDLGLASLEWSEKQSDDRLYQRHRAAARRLLESVNQRGLADPEVTAGLARLYWERESRQALPLARATLKARRLSAGARTNALFVLGDYQLRDRDFADARSTLEQLVQHRRNAHDWMLLGLCHRELGQTARAISAFKTAVLISPTRSDLRNLLIGTLAAAGKIEAAKRQTTALEVLTQWQAERFPPGLETDSSQESR